MDVFNQIKKELSRDWFVQGFSAVPLFLNNAARSGLDMKKIVGFSYGKFLFRYKDDYGEMFYLNSDFKRLWKIIKCKLKIDPDYLRKIRKKYNIFFKKHESLFAKINKLKLKQISDGDLLTLLKKCSQAQKDAVGIAHVVDAIGMELEKDFNYKLAKRLKGRSANANKDIILLTTPAKLTFISREEKSLQKIKKLSGKKKREAIEKHLKKYFWVQNSFAGPKAVTIKSLEKRLKNLGTSKNNYVTARAKKDLIRKLKISKELEQMIAIIDFTAIWQDDRKANGLKSVAYLNKIITEISRRLKLPVKLLYYLGAFDIKKLLTIQDIKKLHKILSQRHKGVFFLAQAKEELTVVGEGYKKLSKIYQKNIKKDTSPDDELRGMVANGGLAVGRAVICKGVKALSKVRTGDVLITSMTRPEFVPVLKKVAAIVTDEGGITCHAAVISRELNIPCIVGTKIATQVLKDGDRVEVDAERGVVRKLSRR